MQLLTDELRRYTLTDEDIGAVEAYRVTSAASMQALLIDREKRDRNPYAVPTTADLRVCNGCNFKAPCWDGGTHPRYEVASTPS